MNSGKRADLVAVLLISLAAVLVYANTFYVPFVYDDGPSISDNPTIRNLWPPGSVLSPPTGGITVSGRPVLNLSFALNYAVSGLNVWSYHAVNLLIHLLAGLTLYGLVRRTLVRPPLAARFADQAMPVALAIAGIWTLHPLQTESVTYLVQRAESLMGLFFLLTLYAFVRAEDSPRPQIWLTVSFCACLLGIGTKEIVALAPVMALLYDRTFLSGTFAGAWRRHRWAHLTLAATWLPLLWLETAGTGGNRGGTMGFNIGISWSNYWLTQFESVTRYVGLSLWPHSQVFDYGKLGAPTPVAAMLWAMPVIALLGATVVALRRWPVVGFLGAWFFVVLAPTSIVPGAVQMIVEHRMYLSLAAVVAGVLGAVASIFRPRTFAVIAFALALAAGTATVCRNALYADPRVLWEDALAKWPSARAHGNLGMILAARAQPAAALVHFREQQRLDPTNASTFYNIGTLLMRLDRLDEAVAPLTTAVAMQPGNFDARVALGTVLTKQGRAAKALPQLTEALRAAPSLAEAHFQLGLALASLERWAEAIDHYAAALRADPRNAQAQSNWGVALARMNDVPAALGHFEAALLLAPELADTHFNLALALVQQGRMDDAMMEFTKTVRLEPAQAEAQLRLGIMLAQSGKLPEGLGHLEQAVNLRPDWPAAHTNFALALLQAHRANEALTHYATALRLAPEDPEMHYNLGCALLAVDRRREAQTQFDDTLKIAPGYTPARAMLQRLRTGTAAP